MWIFMNFWAISVRVDIPTSVRPWFLIKMNTYDVTIPLRSGPKAVGTNESCRHYQE